LSSQVVTKTDFLKEWEEKLRKSHAFHKEKIAKPLDIRRRYYLGDQWIDSEGRSTLDDVMNPVTVNMVFDNITSIVPTVNTRNPKLFVKAKKPPYLTKKGKIFNTIEAAKRFEFAINYLYKFLSVKKENKKCIVDALIGPWGFLYIGFTSEKQKTKDGVLLEHDDNKKAKYPFIVRLSPDDIRIDPTAKKSDLTDADWIAIKWVKTPQQVKDHPDYSGVEDIQANSVTGLNGPDNLQRTKDEDNEWDRVVGWDVWDKVNQKLITVVDTHDDVLREDDWPSKFDGFPVESLYFHENPDNLVPVSDIDIYLSQQDELNRLRSYQLEQIRKVSEQKGLANPSKVDEQELEKLLSGPGGTVAWTKDANPTDAYVPLVTKNVSQDIYLTINTLKQEIMGHAGRAAFETGGATKFDTATEPNLIAQSISARRAEFIDVIQDFVVRSMKKVGQVLQQTLTPVEIPISQDQVVDLQGLGLDKKLMVNIVGLEGDQILAPWMELTKEQIKGDFDFDMQLGSMQPINEDQQKKDLFELLNLIGGSPFIDQHKVVKEILERYTPFRSDLLKTPEQVAQEQQAAQQASIAAEQEVNKPKRDTDLLKTQMKNQTSIDTAELAAFAQIAASDNKRGSE